MYILGSRKQRATAFDTQQRNKRADPGLVHVTYHETMSQVREQNLGCSTRRLAISTPPSRTRRDYSSSSKFSFIQLTLRLAHKETPHKPADSGTRLFVSQWIAGFQSTIMDQLHTLELSPNNGSYSKRPDVLPYTRRTVISMVLASSS